VFSLLLEQENSNKLTHVMIGLMITCKQLAQNTVLDAHSKHVAQFHTCMNYVHDCKSDV
jgi:hypothetical protein